MGVIRCLWYLNWARGKTFSTGRAGEREKKGREGRRKGEVWQTYRSTDRAKSQGYECSVN